MNVRDYYKIVIDSVSRITGVGEIPMICAAGVPNPSGMGRKRFPKLTLSFGPQCT